MAEHDQGDTLRAAQIQAVRAVLSWEPGTDTDRLAVRLVDAVMAAWQPPRVYPDLPGLYTAEDMANASHDGYEAGHAAGYAAAVANLRDVTQRTGSPAARWAADYLEAVGPKAAGGIVDGRPLAEPGPPGLLVPAGDQKLTEEEAGGTGRVWVFSLDAKPDVLFADGKHRYWSTHCRHDTGDGKGHRACSATELTGQRSDDLAGPAGGYTLLPEKAAIVRQPAQCKTCAAPCICYCHKEVG